jgi:hypothetical protein
MRSILKQVSSQEAAIDGLTDDIVGLVRKQEDLTLSVAHLVNGKVNITSLDEKLEAHALNLRAEILKLHEGEKEEKSSHIMDGVRDMVDRSVEDAVEKIDWEAMVNGNIDGAQLLNDCFSFGDYESEVKDVIDDWATRYLGEMVNEHASDTVKEIAHEEVAKVLGTNSVLALREELLLKVETLTAEVNTLRTQDTEHRQEILRLVSRLAITEDNLFHTRSALNRLCAIVGVDSSTFEPIA